MDIFPATIAVGKAFCNRVKERSLLKQYIKHGRHTVLVAPRRYGKTSLMNQTLLELKVPYVLMEFTLATNSRDIEKIIMTHVSDLLHTILPRTAKTKQAILALFNWMHPELVLTAGGQKIIFHLERTTLQTPENLSKLLKQLDAAAALVNKRIVVAMDEFQQLSEMGDHTIEAAIRQAMQYSQQVSYIFSGSNRHMLLSMFNDKNRPFYNACDIMKIERISTEDYIPFIQNASILQWDKPLSDSILQEIFRLTQLHPSYINRLCSYFWLTNQMPTLQKVQAYWREYIASKHAEFTEALLNLSHNQRKVLTHLANFPTSQPSQQAVCSAVNLPEASVRQAVKVLLYKDYLYENPQGLITVLDPALCDFIIMQTNIE